MKRLALPAVPVLAVLALCPAASAQERTVDRSLAIDAGGTLSLESDRGTVNLTSWDQPTVQVHARIEPPQGVSADYARRAVDAVDIVVTGGGRAVTVRADYSKVGYTFGFLHIERSLPRVHFEVKAPRRLDLDLDIDRSDVVLQGFEGHLELALDRSSLDADDLGGSLALRVDRGPNVDVSGLRGTLDLNLDRTEAALHDVRLDGNSRVRLDRGAVDLALTGSQGLTIDGDLDRSRISSELPITVDRRGAAFHGTLNGGGPSLRVSADRSDVRLRAR